MTRKNNNHRILVFAHRGTSKYYPENTIPAFRNAAELNVDYIETDVHLTKDNKFVVIHDKSIDRVTDGRGFVNEYTMSELKQFDAAYNFSIDGGKTYPFRGKGIKLMSLDEMLEAFPGQKFNIDLKDKNINQLDSFIKIINKFKACDRVIIASKYNSNLNALRKLCPEIPTSFSVREIIWILFLSKTGFLFMKKRFNGFAVQIPEMWRRFHIVTEPFIREVHKQNLKVHVWTINKVKFMKRLINIDVDGIMSDDPELLLRVLGRE